MFLKSATYQTLTNFLHQYSGFVFRSYVDLQYGKPKKTIPTGTCIPLVKECLSLLLVRFYLANA